MILSQISHLAFFFYIINRKWPRKLIFCCVSGGRRWSSRARSRARWPKSRSCSGISLSRMKSGGCNNRYYSIVTPYYYSLDLRRQGAWNFAVFHSCSALFTLFVLSKLNVLDYATWYNVESNIFDELLDIKGFSKLYMYELLLWQTLISSKQSYRFSSCTTSERQRWRSGWGMSAGEPGRPL